MSAFSPTSPFQVPDQKQMLVSRLMDQYQEAASRASGLATVGAPVSPSSGSKVNPKLGLTGVSIPRQVAWPQAHSFIPVRGGVGV